MSTKITTDMHQRRRGCPDAHETRTTGAIDMHQRRSIRTSEGGLDVHHLCRKRDQYAHEGRTERSLEEL